MLRSHIPSKVSIPIATPSSNAAWHVEGAKVDTDEPSVTYVAFDGYEIIKPSLSACDILFFAIL